MPIALFDLDGTLVDSSHHQARAWARAFARLDLRPGLWRIHRMLGMGGDQLVGHPCDAAVERGRGDRLREWWGQEFEQLIDEVAPVAGAHEVIAQLADDDWAVDQRAVMIGDSSWDVIAAAKAGVPTITVLAGGYGAEELGEAGAVAVLSALGEVPDALRRAISGARVWGPGRMPEAIASA